VLPTARAAEQIRRIADGFGRKAVVWRYDTVLFSTMTSGEFHVRNFEGIARMLEGAVDEVVISFAHIYRKAERKLSRAAAKHGFSWTDPPDAEKVRLALQLAQCAEARGIRLTVCAQNKYLAGGATPARCVDAERLSEVAGCRITAPLKGKSP
jgi:hypothetical protein